MYHVSHLSIEPVVQVGADDPRRVHRGDAVRDQRAARRRHDPNLTMWRR